MGSQVDKTFMSGAVRTRPCDDGSFDELIAEVCEIHMEMMDDNLLWIGISNPLVEEEVHVTISARGKLSVTVQEA